MIQKRNIIIIAAFFLMLGFGFVWADITVEDVLSFDLAQDDMILFNPAVATIPYSLGIDINGDFIIAQIILDVVTEKFRITPSGDIYIDGNITEGTVPWTSVSVPTDCATGTNVTGVDINGDLICS